MTLENFHKLHEKIKKEEKKKYKFEKEKYDKGIFTDDFKSWGSPFKLKGNIISKDLVNVTPVVMIQNIKEFLLQVNTCTDLKIGEMSQETKIYRSDMFDEELTELYYYQEVESFNYKLNLVEHTNKVFKNKITEELKPKGEFALLTIDCKFLQLYKDGILDWGALQKLVYSTCNL